MPPKKREYQPGFRRGKKYGTIHPSELYRLDFHLGMWKMTYALPDFSDPEQAEAFKYNPGPNLWVSVPTSRATMNITALTLPELEEARKFWNMAFDLVEPVVRERDRIADALSTENDDTLFRLYRRAPSVFIGQGSLDKYRQGLLFGPDEIPGSDRDSDRDLRGVRGAGPGVAADGQDNEERGGLDNNEEIE